jgi:hypothetical protein
VLMALDRHADAEPNLRQAAGILEKHVVHQRDNFAEVLAALVTVSDKLQRPADAAAWRARYERLTGQAP